MKIAVLGTGTVGRTLAERLSADGHDVVLGTRDVQTTLAHTEPDRMGNPPFSEWQAGHPEVRLLPFADASGHAEVLINATSGAASLAALKAVGAEHLDDKVIVDVANPLDFSYGWPPALSPVNTDSLGEQIQRTFPQARVVKTLNTVNAKVMVDPARVPGRHSMFIAGDDPAAKAWATNLLQSFGWNADDIIDLGGIQAARSMEMYLPLWISLSQALGSTDINIHVVTA